MGCQIAITILIGALGSMTQQQQALLLVSHICPFAFLKFASNTSVNNSITHRWWLCRRRGLQQQLLELILY
jgi:hypothetical protein